MVSVTARTGQLLNIADIAKDTGLACLLSRWLTPETLMNGAMTKAFPHSKIGAGTIISHVSELFPIQKGDNGNLNRISLDYCKVKNFLHLIYKRKKGIPEK